MTTIPFAAIPAATSGKLYVDYVAGRPTAVQFYSFGLCEIEAAFSARAAHSYPRQKVASLLRDYNAQLGASARALQNAVALGDEGTMCVIGGQQAGFMGGPAFSAYKIATTIRLAEEIESRSGTRCVPLFWLATEDHDFGEINHAHLVRPDGEIGRVGFDWAEKGRPISALPLTDEIREAYAQYWAESVAAPYTEYAREVYAPLAGEDYARWNARLWSALFADRGLVIVEPNTLRDAAGCFFASVLRHSDEIQDRLSAVAAELTEAGYRPQLTSEDAGQLYTFDEEGLRVRVEGAAADPEVAVAHPERYSTDAALRPLFADAMLPVVASVLGPGETAYQGMLKPLYTMFGVPQPVLFPRKSYTVAAAEDVERLTAYHTTVEAVLTEQIDPGALFERLIPEEETDLFAVAEREIEGSLAPLRPYIEGIDPSMGRTWEQTLNNAQRSLQKLRDRAVKARLSQLGFSKGELRRLQNALLPRGRLQERVLPLSHMVAQHGPGFLDRLFVAGDLYDFGHEVLLVGGGDG